MPPTPFSASQLRDQFSPQTLQRARHLHQSGQVLQALYLSPDTVSGLVQGTRPKPYSQHIQLSSPDQSGRNEPVQVIHSRCSCPMRHSCKHVAAVLLALQPQATPESPPPDPLQQWQQELIKRWPEKMQRSGETSAATRNAEPKAPQKRLLYLLDFDAEPGSLFLQIEVRNVLQDGSFSGSESSRRQFDLSRFLQTDQLPAYVEAIDRKILAHLLADKTRYHYLHGYRLGHDLGEQTLSLILESGRAAIPGDRRGSSLCMLTGAEPQSLQLQWMQVQEGLWLISPAQGEGWRFSYHPPVYLDPERGLMGALELPLPVDLLQHLLAMPAVPNSQLAQVAEAIQGHVGSWLPAPVQVPVHAIEDAPVPSLRFGLGEYRSTLNPSFRRLLMDARKQQASKPEGPALLTATEQFCFVRLEMEYAGFGIDPGDSHPEMSLWSEGRHYLVQRDLSAERQCLAAVRKAGLRPLNDLERQVVGEAWQDSQVLSVIHEEDGWLTLLTQVVPAWRSAGWQITFDDEFPYSDIVIPDADTTWFSDLQPGAEDNTLLLGIGIEVDGEQINLLPCLLDLARRFSPLDLAELSDLGHLGVTLTSGRRLYLPTARIKHLLGILYDLFDTLKDANPEGRLRLVPQELNLLNELDLEHRHSQSLQLARNLACRLSYPDQLQAPKIPEHFSATLRHYQQQGLAWLQLLRETQAGGILADDMGLGKTVQTLAHLSIEQASGRLGDPALLVVPTSLIGNWRREAERFAPKLRVLVLHGSERHAQFERISDSHLIITSYPLVLRDSEKLQAQSWSLVILDEAQAIKNPATRVAQKLRSLKAQHRLCLTGTPMENHLGELWSLFHFLNPGLLRDERSFRRLYRNPIEKTGDPARRRALLARISPFLLRRTKTEVLSELPPKTEMLRYAVLGSRQRDLYETVRAAMDRKVRKVVSQKGLARSQIEILDALLKLRQICCDPGLLKLPAAKQVGESAKLQLLLTLLPEMIEEGRRILIFSQFTQMLDRIEQAIDNLGIPTLKLTGQTRNRQALLDQFQKGDTPVFLVSLKAGGTGLNLTAADTVIHYDPWWNPAVEDQATDRAHRIGQERPVFVYRLIAENTIEEKLLYLQAQKRELADTVYEGGELTYRFTEADLTELFR